MAAKRITSGGAGSAPRVRVPKTAELVAGQIRRQIIRGDIEEGDALLPESELMSQFGVSRPTLREAFRILESESLITVTRGARGGARLLRRGELLGGHVVCADAGPGGVSRSR